MELLVVYLILAAIPAILANNRGRRPWAWFLVSLLISPLLALLLVAVLPSKQELKDRRPCPRCGEKIPRTASLCRFCSTEVAPLA